APRLLWRLSLESPSPPLAVVDSLRLRCGGEGRGEGEDPSSVRVLRPPHPSFGHLLPRFQSIPCHRRTGGEGPRPSPHSSCTTVLGEGAGNPLPKPTAVPSQCDVRRPCSGPLQTERRRPSDSRAVGLGG